MSRPVTLCSGQWADLPLEELALDLPGIRLRWNRTRLLGRPLRGSPRPWPTTNTRSQTPTAGAARVDGLFDQQPFVGQAVLDLIDERHKSVLPAYVWDDGDPDGVNRRAAEELKNTARAAQRLGIQIVNGFTGSSIWHLLYSSSRRLRPR